MGSNQHTPAIVRFEEKYIPEPNSGCWIWIGAATPSHPGRERVDLRPSFYIAGKAVIAYRYAFQTFVGPIPAGKMICHRCGVSLCVNPDHLYAGTAKENAADMMRQGLHNSQLYPGAARERGIRLYERYGNEMATKASNETYARRRALPPFTAEAVIATERTTMESEQAWKRRALAAEAENDGLRKALEPDPEVVGAVQQALMNHPHFNQSSATAFGFANTALKAFFAAALTPSVPDAERS